MSNSNQQYSSSLTPPLGGRGVEGVEVKVSLSNAGKRFNRDWIFRHLTIDLQIGKTYAITGPNGSGKSTLLQAIAGSMYLSEGAVEYRTDEQGISNDEVNDETRNGKPEIIVPEKIYQYISIAAPYLELIEEMTANEFLQFHHRFKSLLPGVGIGEILTMIGLEGSADKQIRYFSSGMKQRIKLAQAIFSDTPVLLLDEPCTNLDGAGYKLYHSLIDQYCRHKLVIVSSNDAQEMDCCEEKINILDYK